MAKSKWPLVKDKLALIEKWARDGLTEAQISANLGISRTTFNEYKKLYPDLLDTLKRGREVDIAFIENALVKRARGYEYEEIKTYIKKEEDGRTITYTEKTKKHLPPDVGACAIILKNRGDYTNDKALLELKKQELELKKMMEEAKVW